MRPGQAGQAAMWMFWWSLSQGKPEAIFKFFALQEDLEVRLHNAVDLVTPDALKRQLRERILAEAIPAA